MSWQRSKVKNLQFGKFLVSLSGWCGIPIAKEMAEEARITRQSSYAEAIENPEIWAATKIGRRRAWIRIIAGPDPSQDDWRRILALVELALSELPAEADLAACYEALLEMKTKTEFSNAEAK